MSEPSQPVRPANAGVLREICRSLRLQQWAKNVFIFVPILTANQWGENERLLDACIAFLTLGAVASGTYLLNDLFDIEADRAHPTKRLRPLAAGTISAGTGAIAAAVLILGGLLACFLLLSQASSLMLLGYLAITLTYSALLKRLMLVDVITLAGLYTFRILIGGVATEIFISPWLLAFSLFLFMSLALMKRYIELDSAKQREVHEIAGRGYTAEDTEAVFTMGLVSGYLSILVLCLYVQSEDVSRLYRQPEFLWALCPVMLYWVSRLWLLARRREVDDDPVAFAVADFPTYVCVGLMVAAVAVGL